MNDLASYAWPNPHTLSGEELRLLDAAVHSVDWSHSKLATAFEERFAEYLGVRFAMLVPSGTFAIYLALVATGIKAGQEVIIPGITWPSVAYAVLLAGGVPRTVDISPQTLCMDTASVREAMNERTFAILATHLFGSQCDLAGICSLASDRGVIVLEDAAQSLGSAQRDKKCGAWGRAGAFSLNDRKVLACGEGGVIVTDDADLYAELKRLQLIIPNRAERPWHLPGTFKISEFQAAVALGQLSGIPRLLEVMASRARLLDTILRGSVGVVPQERPDYVTFQSFFCYAFDVEGVENVTEFRETLSRRLNMRVAAPYSPLSDVTDFRPLRSPLAPEAAASLARRHPNCLSSFGQRTSRIPHWALRADESIILQIAETIAGTAKEFR